MPGNSRSHQDFVPYDRVFNNCAEQVNGMRFGVDIEENQLTPL